MANDLIRDPVAFINQYLPLNEKGKPWSLSRHQRRVLGAAFRWDRDGRLRIRTFVWGEMKKSGKTFLAACLVLWWGFVTPDTEIKIAANDLEQSVGRVFLTVAKLLEHNHQLGLSAKVRASDIVLTNGTTISAIASDYKGAAGSRHSLVVFDELWGYSHEAAQRLYEELTPPPTEENAWLLVVTYAGWTGESVLLERLYKQGLAGERIDDELELYVADELFMFWSHTPRQPWQTDQYYAEQRRSLRPTTFARLHENRWVTSESTFITPELWDGCVDPMHQPILPSKDEPRYLGGDIGVKDDRTAVASVIRRGNKIILAGVRIWKPTREQPLDLETTFEAYLREIHAQNSLRRILVDPWQAYSSIQRLKAAGLPIEEFPQTVSNTVRMGQCLYDVLKGKNLVLYADDELRQQALNTIAIETPRGFRIAKEKASKKIDAVVALSMAVCAALDAPKALTLEDIFGDVSNYVDPDAAEEKAKRGDAAVIEACLKSGAWFPGE